MEYGKQMTIWDLLPTARKVKRTRKIRKSQGDRRLGPEPEGHSGAVDFKSMQYRD